MPNLLIRDARVVPLTADAVADAPVDLLVVDGVIRDVGARLARPAGVAEVAAEGRWIIPGLWDKHAHLGQWTAAAHRLDLAAATSPEDALAAVQTQLRAHPGQPIVGAGMRAGTWTRGARVAELDSVSGEVPVVLINGDCHHGWCNSAALRALELPHRKGVVAEADWFAVYPALNRIVGTGGPDAYREMLQRAGARGIVGVVDLEFGAAWEHWATRWAEGCDLLHIRWGVYPDGLESVAAQGFTTSEPLPGSAAAGARLTMGPLKIISDGSLGTLTAWCCDSYAGEPSHRGAPNYTADELHALLTRAVAADLHVATHAIGDRALEQALDGFEATGARGSIEHAQLVTRPALTRIAELGLTASVQPAHLLDDRDLTERVWPDRTERCFALRWMRAAGIDVALGSDAPVSPLDPWLAIMAAVYRSSGDRPPWHPEQALTVAEAIACSVDGQSLRVGAAGDVVLLDANPLQTPSARLHDTEVALTVVAGTVVHDGIGL